MEILFIFLFLIYGLNSLKTPCQDVKIQSLVSCHTYLSNCFILEGDEEDYSKLTHIDTQIIKPSFLLPQLEEPIVLRIINSFDQKKKIQEKLICSLIRKNEYYIIKKVSHSMQNIQKMAYQYRLYERQGNEDQITFSEKLRFNTKIVSTELCEEIDVNEDGSLNLFCLSQFSLKQYTLNLSIKNTTLIQEHEVPDQIQDSCKIKQAKWNQNYYIIAFYQCSNWKVLQIKNSDIKTLVESSMKDKESNLQGFSFINDVSFCIRNQKKFNFYLIENNSYSKYIDIYSIFRQK